MAQPATALDPRGLTPTQFLALQRQIGNAAAARTAATGPLLQRDPPRTTEQRLTDLEKRQKIQEKKLAALRVDSAARASFDERLASHEQAIARITTGLENSKAGFDAAQVAQAQTDAMQTQLIGAALAVGFAGSFEWLFSAGLGKIGVSAAKITGIVEKVENPANSLVSGLVNIAGVQTATASQREGAAPGVAPAGGAAAGSPLAFMTRNTEKLSEHKQKIAKAFMTRAAALEQGSDEAWERFDPDAQKAIYDGLMNELRASGGGKEELKAEAAITKILEKHMWALWIKGNTVLLVQIDHPTPEHGGPPMARDDPTQPIYDIGTDIEARLTAVGVASDAGVTLTGHWYSSNSPSDWKKLLYMWANTYNESLRV